MRTQLLVRLVMLAAMIPALPGCVFWQIRDELTTTNRQLQDLERLRNTLNQLEEHSLMQLTQANTSLRNVNARLTEVNDNLDKVEKQLANAHTRLETLESIDRSLRSLDQQLLAVKSLVESLGSVMSLFGGSKGEPTAEEAPAEEPILEPTETTDTDESPVDPDQMEGSTPKPES